MARLRDGRTRSDTISTTMRVTLRPDSMLEVPAGPDNGDDGEGVERTTDPSAWAIDAWSPRADEFALEDGDRVFVRTLPGYTPPATVNVQGEVLYPGAYAVRQRDERLSSIIERAGKLTNEAYPQGFRLVRDGTPVAVDLQEALANPGSEEDVVVGNGERDVVKERFMFFDYKPDIRPGSRVYVPAKPQEDEGIDWGNVVSRSISVISTAATVMLAISRF